MRKTRAKLTVVFIQDPAVPHGGLEGGEVDEFRLCYHLMDIFTLEHKANREELNICFMSFMLFHLLLMLTKVCTNIYPIYLIITL